MPNDQLVIIILYRKLTYIQSRNHSIIYLHSFLIPSETSSSRQGPKPGTLIPQGKAMEATSDLAGVERAKVKYVQFHATAREKAPGPGGPSGRGQRHHRPAGGGGGRRLYGSVTAATIAEALESQGFVVDKKQLDLPEPIKKLGTYEVTVRLAPGQGHGHRGRGA